jgi:hypothetical protein
VVLSKRERYIGIGAVSALGILMVYQLIYVPLENQRNDLDASIIKANAEAKTKEGLIKRSGDLVGRWNDMNRSGLLKDESAATSQVYNSVSTWAREANLNPPPALKSDRTDKEAKEFYKLTWRGTANGGMSQIARFLWHIQTASYPVRVTDLTISARKEGTDDLTLQMGIATVYMENAPQSKSVAMAQEGGR